MWSKFTNALKGNNAQSAKEEQSASQGGEVLTKVYEKHPNLSMFQTNESGVVESSDPPSSLSVHNKRNMFKRMSKAALKDDAEVPQTPSFNAPPAVSKKVRDQNESYRNGNGSQLSLNALTAEAASSSSQNMPRRSSFDMLRPSPPAHQDTTRSVKDSKRRPSMDFLRQEAPQPSQEHAGTSDLQAEYDFAALGPERFNSKRSILRDPNTPGTGQNVRFFPRDAFKVITPDHSLSTELQTKPQPPLPKDETPFLDRLAQANAPESSSVTRSSSASKSRPTVAEIFSPLGAQESSIPKGESSDMSLSFSHHIVGVNDNSNLFDVSQQLDIPSFPPPGLGFDVNAPIFDSNSLDISTVETSDLLRNTGPDGFPSQMTSTPHRSSDSNGKGKEIVIEDSLNENIGAAVPSPEVVDEAVFHSREKSPKLPPPLHERSQSFSLGHTLYYSMGHTGSDTKSSMVESEAAYPSSDLKPDSLNSSSTGPSPPKKTRGRAMSDTVFQSMLRSSPKAIVPEADINDESSTGLVVYSGGSSEPDPFSANANTYYTPQTMIPATPPRGMAKHNRKTSKEENLIISLQTQLSMRTELCAQYEADLKARDELVELLSKKLSDSEKDDARKKNALRSWKKKVQELEKACRQLEEAVEDSRQESMERSVMDEASGEALRMLHRRIASLEGEKQDWERREHALQEEVETLEVLVKERSEDVQNLKENLWTRDESERELKEGIREAKEQIEMMGNISMGAFDEEELRRLLMEKDQKTSEETHRFRTMEFALKQELEELKLKYEGLEVQKASWEEQLEELKKQQKTREEEFATLKTELEAQWEHTEKATDKILLLEREKTELGEERDAARADFSELEAKVSNMEVEWNESENKRNELEGELQEVWNLKDLLEKDREELEDALHHEQKQTDSLTQGLQERDSRISELEQEHLFAKENIARLEENIRQRDEEISQYTQRVVERESELERLREEMSSLKREHHRLVSEQNRALQDVAGQQSESKIRMEELIKAKAEADVDIKAFKDKVTILREEVERLRRQVHVLQQESADKEVKIVQAVKQHSQDKEDLAGLNIALDSKQQELELLKRKFNLRGTAGSTPAQPTKAAHHRRDSSIFSATPISRPPSAMSESGTDAGGSTIKKKTSVETPQLSSTKIAALGKSTRINANGASSASSSAIKTVRAGVDDSMGPPPLKSRPSIGGTPTPTGRLSSLSRSSSAKAAPTAPTHTPHRRLSSVTSDHGQTKSKIGRGGVLASPALSVAEQDEKENVDSTPSSARRRSLIPSAG
ncbi:hypothetical protein CVT25_004766 [Psilocybe cyanescens]|uniref:Uncharacterized protein n=1 Tax=Psilocybe cyanescens TaxID=93625 RepID=A0A409VXB6_PSICY|nr:hypothetical protein CVT25_004766 [Psilocybe cyanescens]